MEVAMYIRALELDRRAIVNYARKNFQKKDPASGNGIVPYYDFSLIPGNYDCTNFVSHALLAGGATIYDNGDPATGWYYWDLNNRSYSWSGVINLYDFLIHNNIKGPSGKGIPYITFSKDEKRPYDLGDILQFHNGHIWRHSTIITGFYYVDRNNIGVLVTGRTSSSSYNNNEKAANIYKGASKRVIKLGLNY